MNGDDDDDAMATCSSLRGLVCQRGELRGEQTEI